MVFLLVVFYLVCSIIPKIHSVDSNRTIRQLLSGGAQNVLPILVSNQASGAQMVPVLNSPNLYSNWMPSCQHGGSPHFDSLSHSFDWCQCPPAYKGQFCELESSVCPPAYCLNNGFCENRLGRPQCICASGFQGERCEQAVIAWTRCPVNFCQHGGQCFLGVGQFSCYCTADWFGQLCELTRTTQSPSTTPPTSTSTPRSSSTTTSMPTSIIVKIPSPCAGDPCGSRGVCVLIYQEDHLLTNQSSTPLFRCECDGCCRGQRCELCGNPCVGYKCNNGGECALDEQCLPYCDCSDTSYMGAHCEIERTCDTCAAKPCLHGGVCRPFGRSFQCQCVGGWKGELCEIEPNPCHLVPCPPNHKCVVTALNGAECHSGPGDPCANRGSPCHNNGVCSMAPDPITKRPSREGRCICTPSWEGERCDIPADACTPNPCVHGGTCISFGANFECRCPAHLGGRFCEQCTPCNPNPCQNGGRCVQGDSFGYSCECRQPWLGPLCTSREHPCDRFPCFHGGQCSVGEDGVAQCSCVEGFVGSFCQFRDQCDLAPCDAIGTSHCWTATNGSFSCQCRPGFQGATCGYSTQQVLEPQFCQKYVPCEHGGTCSVDENSARFSCLCPPHHWGLECQQSNCSLGQNPCFLGRCHVHPMDGRALCDCNLTDPFRPEQMHIDVLFTGSKCDKFKGRTYCNEVWCNKRGICDWIGTSIQVSDVRCICEDGFYGAHCQYEVTDAPPSTLSSRRPKPSPTTTRTPCSHLQCPPGANCYNLWDGGALCHPVRIERESYNTTAPPTEPYPQVHECDHVRCQPGFTCGVDIYNEARCYLTGTIRQIVTLTEIIYITPTTTTWRPTTRRTTRMKTSKKWTMPPPAKVERITPEPTVGVTTENGTVIGESFWSQYRWYFIGGGIGLFIFLIILAMLIGCCCYRWRRRKRQRKVIQAQTQRKQELTAVTVGSAPKPPEGLADSATQISSNKNSQHSDSLVIEPTTAEKAKILQAKSRSASESSWTPIASPAPSFEQVAPAATSKQDKTAVPITVKPVKREPPPPPVRQTPINHLTLSKALLAAMADDAGSSVSGQQTPRTSPKVHFVAEPPKPKARKVAGVSRQTKTERTLKLRTPSEYSEFKDIWTHAAIPKSDERVPEEESRPPKSSAWELSSSSASFILSAPPPFRFPTLETRMDSARPEKDEETELKHQDYSGLEFVPVAPFPSRSASDELGVNAFYRENLHRRTQLLRAELGQLEKEYDSQPQQVGTEIFKFGETLEMESDPF